MTKEEAKLVLDNARPQTKEIDRQFYDDEDLNNALDMAIKALEQQTSEVLINLVSEQEKWLSVAGYSAYNVDIAFKSIVKAIQNVHISSTSEDCVSRKAVLDCLTATGLKKFDFILDAREKVNNLPPVTPTHRWNLISEYEPPRDSQLMFCNNQGSVFISRVTYQGEYFSYVGKHGCYENKAGENTGNIIAWAELPQPYEEKRGNSDDSN